MGATQAPKELWNFGLGGNGISPTESAASPPQSARATSNPSTQARTHIFAPPSPQPRLPWRKQSLARSIKTSFRLLKPDRWFSIVFQHWDTSYFATILETAHDCGGELKAAITQTGDVIWSMHKKKNSARVLAGEMILTFYKPANVRKSAPPARNPPNSNHAF